MDSVHSEGVNVPTHRQYYLKIHFTGERLKVFRRKQIETIHLTVLDSSFIIVLNSLGTEIDSRKITWTG
jgi:hypothetical protein